MSSHSRLEHNPLWSVSEKVFGGVVFHYYMTEPTKRDVTRIKGKFLYRVTERQGIRELWIKPRARSA